MAHRHQRSGAGQLSPDDTLVSPQPPTASKRASAVKDLNDVISPHSRQRRATNHAARSDGPVPPHTGRVPHEPSSDAVVQAVLRDVNAGTTPAGRDLVAHFDDVLRGHGPGEMSTHDLVHGDMFTSNVLVADGHVSAVIDIEAIGSGTRAVDYAWLLREGFTVGAPAADLEMVRRAGNRAADPAVLATCMAATAFDITDFEA